MLHQNLSKWLFIILINDLLKSYLITQIFIICCWFYRPNLSSAATNQVIRPSLTWGPEIISSHQFQTTKILPRRPDNILCCLSRPFKFNDSFILLYWSSNIDELSIKIMVWIWFFIIILCDGQPRLFFMQICRYSIKYEIRFHVVILSNKSWQRYQGSSSWHKF